MRAVAMQNDYSDAVILDLSIKGFQILSKRTFLSLRELEAEFGKDFVISRRFPLKQGNRLRPTDEVNESNINLAFVFSDKLSFHDIDCFACLVRVLLLRFKSSNNLSQAWQGELWLVGRTVDLAKAYKQCGVSSDVLAISVFVYWEAERSAPAAAVQYTLPFGSAVAVLFFN